VEECRHFCRYQKTLARLFGEAPNSAGGIFDLPSELSGSVEDGPEQGEQPIRRIRMLRSKSRVRRRDIGATYR